jgi:hypothetical protein
MDVSMTYYARFQIVNYFFIKVLKQRQSFCFPQKQSICRKSNLIKTNTLFYERERGWGS